MLDHQPQQQPAQQLEESANSRPKARHKRVQKIIKYLSLSGTGVGVPGTISLLVSGQPKAALVSGLLTVGVTLLAIAYKFVSGVTNRVLDLIEEELENLEEPLAKWIVNQPKRFFKWLWWWKLNSQFQNQYYESLIDTFRELKIEGFRIGLPVLDLENVFVSLQVAPEIPEKITGAMIQRQVEAEKPEIWDFLAQSSKKKFQAFRRLAVIGPPGSGKTTLLKHLTLIYAKKQNRIYKAPKLIPVLLYLRDIRHLIVKEEPPNLPQLIRQHIQNLPAQSPLNPPANWIEDQLKIGKCLVMLDGLDEVADSEERERVSQWVSRQMATYRKTVFILTSRPHGFKSAPVEQVGTVLEVLPFNSEQVKQFIQSWYLQTEIMSRAGRDTPAVRLEAQNNANDLIERIMDNRAIADMAKNPLLVTMIATVHYCGSALPGRRVELYQRICDLLLGPRQEAKNIETPLTGEQNKSVLQVLALALMQGKTREFTPAQGQELILDELERVAGNTLTPSQFLKQIKEVSGLLVERELGVYEFAHLSFQEYLAAAQVKELQQDNLLTENLQEPWWAETIRLYAAQSDATNLIQKAIENPTVNSLTLALDCLQESLKVEPAIREQLEEMLEAGLESPEPEVAKLAAEVRLSRRLSSLFEIDENLEIDPSYITCAEYQLFVDQQLNSGERFQAGSAIRPITQISYQNALEFCNWLSIDAPLISRSKGFSYYRLPTATEVQNYPAKVHRQLGCWTIGESHIQENGLRVVKERIPSQYAKLANYLAAGEWERAAQETAAAMLKVANRESEGGLDVESIEQFPPQDLRTIDQLWLQYSSGRFGLGVQASVWESLGGNQTGHLPLLWCLSGSVSTREILSALAQRFVACSIERSLPLFEFDVVTVNAQGQEIQREHHHAQYFTEDLGNSVTLEMVSVPGGTFEMGSPEGEKYRYGNESPQHEVTVQHFFMGKYPVTQAQWKAIASLPQVERDLKPSPSSFKDDNRPFEGVNWYDAVEFCARLSRHTRRKYRLPSEAEWEYACRASTTTPFHFGETITKELVNFGGQETTPVGSFPPNAFGLYDMHGNVREWCADPWHGNYKGAPRDGSAWETGADKGRRVLRGGSWGLLPGDCRSACRDYVNPDYDDLTFGFRVVCVPARTLSP